MVARTLLSPTVVTVSKGGVDALSPPAVAYDYLALDSRLSQGRPLEVGLVVNYVFMTGGKIYFSTSYPTPPAVDFIGYSYNAVTGAYGYGKSLVLRDTNGSGNTWQRSSWLVHPETDGFTIIEVSNGRHPRAYGTTVNLIYYAWQVQ